MHKTLPKTDEIQLYLLKDCSKSKKALAYANSLSNKVNAIDIAITKGTGTIWQTILAKLDKTPKEILDKSKPYYQANIRGRDFDPRDWMSLLMNNPDLVRSPIAIRGDKAVLLDNPTDIFKI